jgi:hypothetical protein
VYLCDGSGGCCAIHGYDADICGCEIESACKIHEHYFANEENYDASEI